MKRASLILTTAVLFLVGSVQAQGDKSKRPSPPAEAKQLLASGATVTINYSQPALKGRTIGKDVEPMKGQLWRAGANEATVFEVDKPVMVEGKTLEPGKYALFMMPGEKEWTIIFNKTWKTWGAYDYEKNKAEDALLVQVKPATTEAAQERLTYTIDKDGLVKLLWGDLAVGFTVK
jgi:hypothetical protein